MATQYTDTFKPETLRYLQNNPQKTRKQIADESGIAHGTLKGWCSVFKEDEALVRPLSNPPTTKELEQQIKKLKKELELAHQDIDILKSSACTWPSCKNDGHVHLYSKASKQTFKCAALM